MKVRVDAAACQGHGRCYALAPDVFETDDHGHCVVPAAEVAPEREAGARAGAENCPEDAITLHEG
ncbi:MAG TPA: ferredoxin [Acidimicrobiia bacterium]|nr:ferredoxin [Acidimicrobiia bacterium]